MKQGQNKEGKTVLYLVFEYMDTDLKKYIRSFRQTGDNIPSKIVKVQSRFYWLLGILQQSFSNDAAVHLNPFVVHNGRV